MTSSFTHLPFASLPATGNASPKKPVKEVKGVKGWKPTLYVYNPQESDTFH
ncbi:MAG: hypothetical protein IJA03_04580 [Bacteroidaceae bacterium]|nr:hypothetical protein [Bacteroidaceae bacterium]